METELTVQQVSEKTGLSEHTLRYYERIGLITPIHRASNGHRRYSEEDVEGINFVRHFALRGCRSRPSSTISACSGKGRSPCTSGWSSSCGIAMRYSGKSGSSPSIWR